jgi:uncharacterized protein with GYD domain
MATYVLLFRFTQKGVENIKEAPARIEKAKNLFKDLGAEVKQFFALMGEYDTMFIVEAPNDETVAKASLAIASFGNVSPQTLRAFTEQEFGQIVADLP